jgi:hypothetical protein
MRGWSGERRLPVNISDEVRAWVQEFFPDFVEGTSLEFTSPVDYNYNCLSWAFGCNTAPYWRDRGGFWPWNDVPDDTVDGWVRVCEIHGFVQTQDSGFVIGFEKIAILKDKDGDLHAARSDRDGRSKSKLGIYGPDIDHDGLVGLEMAYGKVVKVLQRHRPDWLA